MASFSSLLFSVCGILCSMPLAGAVEGSLNTTVFNCEPSMPRTLTATTSTRRITTRNYPGSDYDHNIDCSLRIDLPSGFLGLVMSWYIDLDPALVWGCDDYVQINGGSKLCEIETQSEAFYHSSVNLNFHTDSRNTYAPNVQGFEIEYKAYGCNESLLASIPNSQFSYTYEHLYGATVNCLQNYFIGASDRTLAVNTTMVSCDPTSNTWEAALNDISCELLQCPLPTTHNYTLLNGTNSFGMLIQYSCPDGFESTGPMIQQCQEDWSWSAEPPTCNRRDCGFPPVPDPSRMSVKVQNNSTLYQSTGTYTCTDGFHMAAGQPSKVTCLQNGSWSGIPTCSPGPKKPAANPQAQTGDNLEIILPILFLLICLFVVVVAVVFYRRRKLSAKTSAPASKSVVCFSDVQQSQGCRTDGNTQMAERLQCNIYEEGLYAVSGDEAMYSNVDNCEDNMTKVVPSSRGPTANPVYDSLPGGTNAPEKTVYEVYLEPTRREDPQSEENHGKTAGLQPLLPANEDGYEEPVRRSAGEQVAENQASEYSLVGEVDQRSSTPVVSGDQQDDAVYDVPQPAYHTRPIPPPTNESRPTAAFVTNELYKGKKSF